MNAEQWKRVRELFERAQDLPEDARRAFLNDAAAEDPVVRERLVRMLDWAEGETDYLASPAPAALASSLVAWQPAPGEVVGGFEVVRAIGRGGMGSVYEARQERPERAVALKLMSVGLESETSRRRFEAEAEILGRQQHPGIASVFAAGVHPLPEGGEVPYLAMELVEGARDVVSFARERGLDLRGRIELFRRVCDAVHHAHQKGVMHRDLKPGNVLVGAAGEVKVIDYGVARVFRGETTDTRVTQAGLVLGTLQYMSPEQLGGSSDDVDIRTDVYALGVILYELVAERLPYDAEGRSLTDIVAQVCEKEPPAPSRHAAHLPREIDWITLRALAKEPERRYGSAAQLADDLGRFLADEVVLAGPPSRSYRVKKFVARNRATVTVGVLLLVSLIAGIVGTTLARIDAEHASDTAQRRALEAKDARDEALAARDAEAAAAEAARRSQQEAEQARDAEAASARKAWGAMQRQRAVLEELRSLISGMYPHEDGREVTLFELLERKRPTLGQDTPNDPALNVLLWEFFGNAYMSLAMPETAAELFQKAVDSLDDIEKQDPLQNWEIRRRLADIRLHQLRTEEGEELLEAAIRDLMSVHEPGLADELAPQVAGAMRTRAILQNAKGNYEEAARLMVELIEFARARLSEKDPLTAITMAELGDVLKSSDPEAAEEWVRDALELAEDTLGFDAPHTLIIQMRLGTVLSEIGKVEEAAELQRDVVERMADVFGPTSINTLQARFYLTLSLARLEETGEAEELGLATLKDCIAVHKEGGIHLEASIRGALATVYRLRGEVDAEREQLVEGIRRMGSIGQGEHPLTKRLEGHLEKLQP